MQDQDADNDDVAPDTSSGIERPDAEPLSSGQGQGEESPGEGSDSRTGPERRLHLRAYKFWYNLLRGRLFPVIADMGREGLDPFRENALLLDFPTGNDDPVLRFVGATIAADLEDEPGDGIDISGVLASDLPSGSIISRLIPHYLEVFAHRAPVGFEAEYDNPRGLVTMYRGILLPFSDNNADIHFILGVIGWREVEKSDATIPLSPDNEIAAKLAAVVEAGRAAAGAVHHVDSRSRESLYEALAHALGLYEESLIDRISYEQLLAKIGVREQARAPFTPVVKLVFGAAYDKTRITEYATALSYAHRLGVVSSELKEFLLFHEGGIKGCVQQERRSRRAAKGEASGGTASGPGAGLESTLGAMPSLAEVELPKAASGAASEVAGDVAGDITGDDDFVLLLGRRQPGQDKVEIVARVEEKSTQMDAILRRVVAAQEVDSEDDGTS